MKAKTLYYVSLFCFLACLGVLTAHAYFPIDLLPVSGFFFAMFMLFGITGWFVSLIEIILEAKQETTA